MHNVPNLFECDSSDCFGCFMGRCMILSEPALRNGSCSFFKDQDKCSPADREAYRRLYRRVTMQYES